ncbi:hypothetical protein [uncultured Tenacibaculum sp.]|uniref:hypothetical protein n=1 Tax=uncultured Tenacibaculum sp. TaxID=174713 RepID=UPI002620AB34|nr:hypothetical protein [uncultured Tenacibaculum sp.]
MKKIHYIFSLFLILCWSCSTTDECSENDQEVLFTVRMKLIDSDGTNFLNNPNIDLSLIQIMSNDNNIIGVIDYIISGTGEQKVVEFSMAQTRDITIAIPRDTFINVKVNNIKTKLLENCNVQVESFDAFTASQIICTNCNTDDTILEIRVF